MPRNSYDRAGYGSKFMIQNLSSMFIYVVIEVLLACLLSVVICFQQRHRLCSNMMKNLHTIIVFQMFIRLVLEGYLEFCISSIMNLQYLNYDASGNAFSSFLSYLMAIFVIIFPIFAVIFLTRSKRTNYI